MNLSWISARTRWLAAGGFGAAFAVFILGANLPGQAATIASDVGETLVVALAAFVILRTALQLDPGEPLRRRWMLIGAGVALFAAGDAAWAFIELVLNRDPFGTVADVLYLVVYPVLGAGLISAAMAFRHFVDLKRIGVIAAIACVGVAALLWTMLLRDVVAAEDLDLVSKGLSLAYPLGDVIFLLGPALAGALAVRSMGTGRLAAPWWALVAGVTLLALTDATFAWLDWQELYRSGNPVDIGWMLGFMLIGIGGSLTRDLLAPVAVTPSVDRQSAA